MKYISASASKILQLLPEGKFKEFLRKIYGQHVSRACEKWYKLNNLIKDTVLLHDGEFIYIELNNGLTFYDKRVPQPSEDLCYKYGKKEKLDKLKSMENFRRIYLRLYQEFCTDQHWKNFELNKGDIVVDAGAEIGSFTIKAADIVGPKGKVIAIEPEINNLTILKKNIEANCLENVIVVPKGLWSRRCAKKLYLDDWPGLHSLLQDRLGSALRQKKDRHFVEIDVDTLDNILRDLKLDHVNLIKMDIEGAEIEALKGAENTLNTENMKLVIEAFHKVNGKPTYKSIIPKLQEMGFKTVINEKLYVVYATKII